MGLKKAWQPTPIYSLGEFHGQRSLQFIGWSPWGHKELDMMEKVTATNSSIRGQRSLVGYVPWGRNESGLTEQLSLWFEQLTLSLLLGGFNE